MHRINYLLLPVNNFVFVQVLQAQDDAGGVEDGPGLAEHVRVDVHHEITAGRVLHHEAHVARRLEAGEHVHEERVAHGVGHLEDALLGQEGLHLVPGNDVALLQGFDCKVFTSVDVPCKNDLKF